MSDVETKVIKTIVEFFKLEGTEIVVDRETVASNVPGWDSLAHATLIFEIENELDIEFDIDEIGDFDNVGELIDAAAKLAG